MRPQQAPQHGKQDRQTPLRDLLAPIRWSLRAASGLSAIGAIASIAPLIGLAELAKLLLTELPDVGAIRLTVILIAFALLVRLICVLSVGALTQRADVNLKYDLSMRIVRHLQRVPLGWFSDRKPGDIREALQDDIVALHHFVAHGKTDPVAAIAGPFIALAYMVWCDWRMTIVAITPVVVGLFLLVLQYRGTADRTRAFQQGLRDLSSASVRYVRDIATIRTFGETGQSFRQTGQAFLAEFGAWIRHKSALSALTDVVLSPVCSIASVLTAGLYMVQAGWIAAVDVLPFIVLAPGLTAPFAVLAFSRQTAIESKAAARRILQTLQTKPLAAPHLVSSPKGTEVCFDDVHFSYQNDQSVLNGVSMTLTEGTTTALVGASGAGKSTLASLLPRFREPTKGRITLGGSDIRDIDHTVLRRRIGCVFQDAHILRDTVQANIALGLPSVTTDAIFAAARNANIHDELCALPHGYDTVLGRDVILSGGQAQRLAIARLFLAEPDILVLDEATAMVDPETQSAIDTAINSIGCERTVLTIAHRPATIRAANQICVLDQGRILETGTHECLLARGGAYAALMGNSHAA